MAEPLVYIVDDDGQVLTSVGFLLQTLKIRCRTFAGAEIFLDSVDSLEPGCIISDLNMPGMSGIEGIGLLRSRFPDLPILAFPTPADWERWIEAQPPGARGVCCGR